MLAAYVVGGLLVVPVTALIVATGIVFGPLLGSLYAFARRAAERGGHLLDRRGASGRHAVRRLAGSRLNRITRRLAKKGMVAIAVIRLLPIAPFSVVNAVAGASHIRLREFMLGTALGMFPGIVATVVFVDRVDRGRHRPRARRRCSCSSDSSRCIVAIALFVHRRLVRATAPAPQR